MTDGSILCDVGISYPLASEIGRQITAGVGNANILSTVGLNAGPAIELARQINANNYSANLLVSAMWNPVTAIVVALLGTAAHGNPLPTGNVVLNLNGVSSFANVYPFINMWKVGENLEFRRTDGTVIANTGNYPLQSTQSPWGVYCDTNGDFINPFPDPTTGALVTVIRRIIFKLPTDAAGPPNLIAGGGQSMTAVWDDGAGWVGRIIVGNASVASSATSPFVFTWPTAGRVDWQWDVGGPTPPRNFRFCRSSYAAGGAGGIARLAAGEIMDPDYIAQIKAGAGILRFSSGMQGVNSDVTVTSIDQISTEANFQWGTSEQAGQSGIKQCPLSVMARSAVDANKIPWVSIPCCFIQQKSFQFNATASNPAHCSTFTPHTYVNGDTVIPYFSDGANNFTGNFRKLLNPTSFAGDTFTLASHGLVDGYPLQLGTLNGFDSDGQTYPSPIVNKTTYYAKSATANTFKISATPLGTALTLTGSAPATINIILQLQGNRYTVANANQAAGTFDLSGPGSDTTGWVNSGGHYSGTPFDLAWMNTQVQRFVNAFKATLPSYMVGAYAPIYEFSNELWNNIFLGYQTIISQINNNIFSNNNFIATGYFMAACAKGVRDAYGGDHTKYKFPLGCNVTFTDILPQVIAGVDLFIANNAPTLTRTDLFDYLEVTSYTGGTSFGGGDPGGYKNVPVTFGTNTCSFGDANHAFPFKFTAVTGSMPAGLSAGTLGGTTYPSGTGTIYWVKPLGGGAWSLHASPTGPALTFPAGAGTYTMTWCQTDVIQFLMSQGQTFFNQAISDDQIDGRWTFSNFYSNDIGFPAQYSIDLLIARYNYFQTNYLAVGKPLHGMGLISYEGGESNNPSSGFPLFNDATWRSMYAIQQYSQGSADNFLQIKTRAVDTGLLTNQAQFVDFSVLTYNFGLGNFGAQQFVGDQANLRWQGILAANN